MREVKPLANEAKDLLDKAIILIQEIQEHFNDKAGAAEERGRQDVQERWDERFERMDEAATSASDAIDTINETFDG